LQSICKRDWIADRHTGQVFYDNWSCALVSECSSFDLVTRQLSTRVAYTLCNETAVACSCSGDWELLFHRPRSTSPSTRNSYTLDLDPPSHASTRNSYTLDLDPPAQVTHTAVRSFKIFLSTATSDI